MRTTSTQPIEYRAFGVRRLLAISGVIVLTSCTNSSTGGDQMSQQAQIGLPSGTTSPPVSVAETELGPDASVAPTEQVMPLEVATEELWPTENSADLMLFADQLAVFSVERERDGAPEGEEEPYIPRFVTVRILDNLWTSPGVTSVASQLLETGSEIEITTWGAVVQGDGRTVPITAEGMPRLEVGETYVGAFVPTYGELGLYPESLALVSGGKLQLEDARLLSGLGDLAGLGTINTTDDLQAAAEVAMESPRVASTVERYPEWMSLSPQARLELMWDEPAELTPVTEPSVDSSQP